MKINSLLELMVKNEASDLFLRAGGVPRIRVNGGVSPIESKPLEVEDLHTLIEEITNDMQRERFKENKDCDFAFFSEELNHRFRVSIFLQRGSPSLVIRRIRTDIQSFEELDLPSEVLKKLSFENRGLILMTGAAGSGKSTAIASMIECINTHCNKHILTVEEPIEFTFKDKRSLINQRELGLDVISYPIALKAFTLQSPDVIFIGNIRDPETMFCALRAAQTGVLVLSTLHTINAPQTVERIINFFPPHQHPEIRMQLSLLLKGILCLRLVPRKDKPGRIPAYEAMLLTPTVSRLIREGKIYEIPQFIEQGKIFGMQSFRQSLISLVDKGRVSLEEAYNFADNRDELELAIKGIRK